METNGIVFVCVIFVISIALVGFCCLKIFTSEDKYEMNPGTGIVAPVLPTSAANPTVRVKRRIRFPQIPPYIPKLPPLGVGNNQIIESNGQTPELLPPKPGFIVVEPHSASQISCLSAYPSKPPPIGFGYDTEGINIDTAALQCPYPTVRQGRHRTPSPVYRTSYSPRTSLYFTESERPISGISFSSENLDTSSKSRPPSYSEALQENQLLPATTSAAGQFSKCKQCR